MHEDLVAVAGVGEDAGEDAVVRIDNVHCLCLVVKAHTVLMLPHSTSDEPHLLHQADKFFMSDTGMRTPKVFSQSRHRRGHSTFVVKNRSFIRRDRQAWLETFHALNAPHNKCVYARVQVCMRICAREHNSEKVPKTRPRDPL